MSGKKNHSRYLFLFLIPLTMLVAAYASVPLYNAICKFTGWSGTPLTSDTDYPKQLLHNTQLNNIDILFDANVEKNIPLVFHPEQRKLSVTTGQTNTINYILTNNSSQNQPLSAIASFNVTPLTVGKYFVKIDCFCFTEQTIQPGHSLNLPVTFYIDPDISRDIDTKNIDTITLSYTFYTDANLL